MNLDIYFLATLAVVGLGSALALGEHVVASRRLKKEWERLFRRLRRGSNEPVRRAA